MLIKFSMVSVIAAAQYNGNRRARYPNGMGGMGMRGAGGRGGPRSPMGGGGGGGRQGNGVRGQSSYASNDCRPPVQPSNIRCATNGGSYWSRLNLSYDAGTGKFSGDITTSQCPPSSYNTRRSPQYNCQKQLIPDANFLREGPKAIPVLGRIGLTKHGVNIYSAFEAGFGSGRQPKPCSGNTGYCSGGLDVKTCESGLSDPNVCHHNALTSLFMDDCGGHATPYHLHEPAACEDPSDTGNGHSPMLGVALDGHAIYGIYESMPKQEPTDLDACNGHYHDVPADQEHGIPAHRTYHYHFTRETPFTLGCYGPVQSLTQCKGLYKECSSEFVVVPDGSGGSEVYAKFCPCYKHKTERTNWYQDMLDVGETVDSLCMAVTKGSGEDCSGNWPAPQPPVVTQPLLAEPPAELAPSVGGVQPTPAVQPTGHQPASTSSVPEELSEIQATPSDQPQTQSLTSRHNLPSAALAPVKAVQTGSDGRADINWDNVFDATSTTAQSSVPDQNSPPDQDVADCDSPASMLIPSAAMAVSMVLAFDACGL